LQNTDDKQKDKKAPGILNRTTGNLGDLKVQNTPFFQADIRYGIDPQYAVVFNHKDKIRYERLYPDIEIYFWVDWMVTRFVSGSQEIHVQPMTGIWYIPFNKLIGILKNAPLHYYQQRKYDTKGNAKASYVLNLGDEHFVKLA